ncbi:C1 family peptidase [Streptomyces sp. CBMA123]|uniref:C1 family peptidase n=1 Tax=Streptomyces sp. CBMA123 TaxID=1896313 RepID=UPI0016620BC0|nr:C1 family peptidase [Streptomyces sp. CBMA123]MBD0695814.1 peptidase [Streptomyces sp. CBMA123]
MRIKKTAGIASALALSCLIPAVTASAADAAPGQAPQHHQRHGLGFIPASAMHPAAVDQEAGSSAQAPLAQLAAVPASADLTRYAPVPGDQGEVNSCVTWATGYTGYGILMHEQGIGGAPMAPMYIYSQVTGGHDEGTGTDDVLSMEKKQGIDTRRDYWQGDFDYRTQPDAKERANAAKFKLSGYKSLPAQGSAAKAAIESAISQGMPVPIGMSVRQSFMDLNSRAASNYSYLPGDSASDPVVGGHEVTVVGYNAKGVKIENSWGTGWGAGGFVTVPWSFFDTGDVDEVHAMGKLVQG